MYSKAQISKRYRDAMGPLEKLLYYAEARDRVLKRRAKFRRMGLTCEGKPYINKNLDIFRRKEERLDEKAGNPRMGV